MIDYQELFRKERRVSESKSVQASGGIGFFGLLAIVFITLKLCHVINWSWWWVLAPIWGPVVFALLLLVTVVCTPAKRHSSDVD